LISWDVIDYNIDFEQHDQNKSENVDGPSNICYSVTLMRKYDWFTFNNIYIMGFVSSLVFLVGGIPMDGLADRASVTLGLLLTVVAQKFSVADLLPKLSYLTVMDLYILCCFALIIVIAF